MWGYQSHYVGGTETNHDLRLMTSLVSNGKNEVSTFKDEKKNFKVSL